MKLYKEIINSENGNVLIVALLMLVILTLIGISASRTSTTDMQVARNQIPHKQDFYIAEAGQNREAAFIGGGGHPIVDVNTVTTLVDNLTQTIFTDKTYDYTVVYEGHFLPPKGYATNEFARYDFSVDTKGGVSDYPIYGRYYKIGPMAQ